MNSSFSVIKLTTKVLWMVMGNLELFRNSCLAILNTNAFSRGRNEVIDLLFFVGCHFSGLTLLVSVLIVQMKSFYLIYEGTNNISLGPTSHKYSLSLSYWGVAIFLILKEGFPSINNTSWRSLLYLVKLNKINEWLFPFLHLKCTFNSLRKEKSTNSAYKELTVDSNNILTAEQSQYWRIIS